MFTLIGWQKSVDEGGVLTALAACQDQSVTYSGTKIVVPTLNQIVAIYAAPGNTATHVQLQSPSLRKLTLLDLAVMQSGINGSGAESFQPNLDTPLPLEVGENLEAYINADPGSAEMHTILVWLADGPLASITGVITTLQFIATITAVEGVWANGLITLGQSLPVGRYQIVGASVLVQGGTLVAFRFVDPVNNRRPGGLGCNDRGAKCYFRQRYGGMGAWMEFVYDQVPTMDILAGSTGSKSLVGYLDLIKVA